MNNYLRLSDKTYPLHEGDIRLLYPEMGEEFILPEGFVNVEHVELPEFDSNEEQIIQIEPICENDIWIQQWKIEPLPFIEKEAIRLEVHKMKFPKWTGETWVDDDPQFQINE